MVMRKSSASSRPARRRGANAEFTSKGTDAQRQRLERLAAMPDKMIDTSDIPEVTERDNAVQGRLFRPRKEAITIRVDTDVLEWFRQRAKAGRGYQTAINAALREHVARRVRGSSLLSGPLRGTVTVEPGTDLTQPTGEKWKADN